MSDPHWDKVVFLSHFNSLTDEAKGATITPAGAAAITTAQKMFGTGSLYLDGADSWASVPASEDFNLGTEPFTIEGWFRFTSLGSAELFNASDWDFYLDATKHLWATYGNSYLWSSMATDTWYAVAFERDDANVCRFYIDGVMVNKLTGFTYDWSSTSPFVIGGNGGYWGGYNVNGYVDEVRVTKGVARYASDAGYTVHTEEFSNTGPVIEPSAEAFGVLSKTLNDFTLSAAGTAPYIEPGADPHFDHVVMLMHCDDFHDVISNTDASNGSSAASVNTSTKKMGSGSIKTGAGALTLPASSNWDFGTGAFTVEFLGNSFANNVNGKILIGPWNAAAKRWCLQVTNNGRLEFTWFDNFPYVSNYSTGMPSNGVWAAYCVDRDNSGTLRIYRNGVMMSKTAGFNYDISGTTDPLVIGSMRPTSASFDSNMYFDEIRVTKGIARYANDAGYKVRTTPFPDAAPVAHDGISSVALDAFTVVGEITRATPHHGVLETAFDDFTLVAEISAAPMAFAVLDQTLEPVTLRARGIKAKPLRGGAAAFLIGA